MAMISILIGDSHSGVHGDNSGLHQGTGDVLTDFHLIGCSYVSF